MNLLESLERADIGGDKLPHAILITDAGVISENYAKYVACKFAGWYSIEQEFDFHPDYGWRNINTGETYQTIDELFDKWSSINK